MKLKKQVFYTTFAGLFTCDVRFIKDSFIGVCLSHLYYYPVPSNLNYFWGFGSLLGGLLILQVVTGLLLAIHYTSDINGAFYSVEFIMRNVQNG
jgi:ubiquinol-cytochrome c reductase cytochrome b subunit